MKKPKKTTKNSRILRETMVALGALKEQTSLSELPLNEIQIHLLDDSGDGVILCLEYADEFSGELRKTFSCVDEFYDDTVEVELEGEESEDNNALFDEEYYGGRTNFTVEVLDDVSGEAESSFIEEAISEEYDEIFHNATKKPSSLLN